ncbi:MAG: 50S ribosomal protein L22 [Candidatus Pacearchaeota archaeon]|nr:50S ribosomal protein L22 [Candidatus Pacearchaeota archaeon]
MNEKKTRVVVKDSPISTKHSVALCKFIKKRSPKEAMELLEKVIKKKLPVPMRGEVPHKKGIDKQTGGRYPVKAAKVFLKALKNLIANSKIKGLDPEKIYICTAKADKASRPVRATRIAFGAKRFKRTHILLEAKEKNE